MKTKNWKLTRWVVPVLLLAMTLSLWSQLELPAPNGPYTVGRTIFRWVDPSRPEVLTDNPDDFREVVALVWYPAVPGTGVPAEYVPDRPVIAKALAESGEISVWEVFGLRFIRSTSPLAAEPVRDQGAFPVVMLSPGNGTNVAFYTRIAAELASHGYIVIGLDHPYDVAAVELADGRVAPYDKDQWLLEMSAHQGYTAERIKVRVADVLFALDQLTRLNSDSTQPLAGLLDLDSVAATGHSLGGITASEACKADARLRACLNWDGLQAGSPFSTDFTAAPPTQPFLFLTKESQIHPRQNQKFESTAESYWVVIHDAAHHHFTDGPSLMPTLLPFPNQADHFMTLIQDYSLAFLDQTLKGQTESLLKNPAEQETVTIHIFPPQ